MGLKDAAKTLMANAGVPVTPGYLGEDQTEARLQSEADRIGYPVLIKAVAGGGGKGMRKVEAASDFLSALGAAKREAAAAFGDDRVLLETYVTRPRHIEVQVFADSHGAAVHLFERDCSLQRRHQKVIEEAPAPGMSPEAREAVTSAAVRAAQAVGYQGAGTVEFIADASEGLRGDRIFFMEMNTRLQVEHPVTEMITGQDLVEWQLRVASGEPLPLRQDQLSITGHAMEARLYAESPATGFLPSTGPLDHFVLPEPITELLPTASLSREAGEVAPKGSEGVGGQPPLSVEPVLGPASGRTRGPTSLPQAGERRGGPRPTLRIDSAVEQGGEVSVFYDPMIAKLIAHAPTRDAAAGALAAACRAVEVWPVRTNAAFLARCLDHPDFLAGEVDTGFIPARLDALVAQAPPSEGAIDEAAAMLFQRNAFHTPQFYDPESPWNGSSPGAAGFRLNSPRRQPSMRLQLGAEVLERPLELYETQRGAWTMVPPPTDRADASQDGNAVVFENGEAYAFSEPDYAQAHAGAESDGAITAPMPGRIVSVDAQPGQTVAKGAKLVTLEAMKMEHGLTAPFDGVVAEVNATPGGQVSEGTVLVRLEVA
jgi:acetyl/propionyl-CoA carboxylase alpha subunit